jgi:hypothetical protein
MSVSDLIIAHLMGSLASFGRCFLLLGSLGCDFFFLLLLLFCCGFFLLRSF